MKIRKLSNKEIRSLLKNYEFLNFIKQDLKNCFIVEQNDCTLYIIDGKVMLIKKDGFAIPSIHLLIKINTCPFPYVTVDDGAVKHILNGADVLRPGIVEYSNFSKGDIVCILDQKNRLLGVGIALVSSDELKKMQKGKVVKNLHYFGDKYFKFSLK